ncbi:uncharacterized protein LOC127078241 [Lathyrus oleraceus]|uniref:Uncharacterized protein n=1 Tax=Pisum sativum TaxID=3888 RepID=A0A9D5BE63_PEA|nr:uncharacterized protein LOC127078241 [Pisum sativum]XP_050874783.1 uncharacterized protein LOC127078241 [Pisum sativum]KAI5441021.1 hypothetical protein KIW84_010468 [Pisum sativum]
MPSGAKKRKAAKKKKEIESSTSTNNPQGENELKSIDEKGSDGGEGDSPRNQDEDHNQFNEGSDEVEEIEPSAVGVKSEEEVRKDSKVEEGEGGKEGVDVIEWDMKSDESSENKDVSVVRVEAAEELNNGSGNSGGTSNDVVETGTAKHLKDESYNNNDSVKETAVSDEEAVNSIKGSVNSAAESSAGSVNVVNSVSEIQSGDTGNNLLEKPLGSQGVETDLAVKTNGDKVHVLPDENVKASSLEEHETREFDGKVSSSPVSQGVETDIVVNRNEDKVHVLPDENVETSSLEEPETREFDGKVSSSLVSQGVETDIVVKTNEDKVHVLTDENVKTSSLEEPETREFDGKVSSSPVSQGAETDLTVKRNEDKVHNLPDENVKTSILEESETREFDGKVSSSPVSQGPITESSNGVERFKDSNTAECSENQPPVASAPHIVQKTSWLSCCGLFEVLSRSNR